MPAVEAGQPVPAFSLPSDSGTSLGPADFPGRKLVLYFYPKDDTSGCTLEAIEFTARAADFAAADTVVLGISRDSVKSHCKFRDKHALGIPLLSDADGTVTEAFGVWVEKSMYGRKYMGIERATFLVGRSGTVARVWRNVKVPRHVDEVLAAARAL
ncbi:MAG: peroxiredoxin [Amaricoccus sp.]